MGGTTFDDLSKRLVTRRLTRLTALRGLAVGAVASVTGLRLLGEEGEAKKKDRKKGPTSATCLGGAALCSSTDECCPSTTGRICAQNGCAIPDRPRCCAGVGTRCSGACECCGPDLQCLDRGDGRRCYYAPR